jgi:chitinase
MTEPSDSGDTTPPTMPGNLDGYGAGNEEAALSWTQSTDNVDPQFAIRYEIFVNGDRHPESDVTGSGETIAFGVEGQLNTFEVVAVDSAGNRSAPASITICLAAFCN